MRDARNIFVLVALTLSLGVYDVLKERMNFSTVVSLIVVLIFFAIWLVAFVLLNKFVFNKSTEGDQTEKDKPQKLVTSEEKNRQKPVAKTGDDTGAVSSATGQKAKKKHDRSGQKSAEPQKPAEKTKPAEPVSPEKPVSSAEPIQPDRVLANKLNEQKLAALNQILTTTCLTPGISGAAIVTHGGILLASTTLSSSPKDLAIGICASSFALATRMSIRMGREQLKELVVRGDGGFLFFRDIAEEAFLIIIADQSMLIGGVIKQASRCANSAASVLKS